MRFEGFYGNTSVLEQLARLFDDGRLPHAILIDGPEGSGRRTLSAILARAAVCGGKGEKPCGVCRACVNALGGNHPDIAVFSGSGGARSFSVDTVRRIRLDAGVAPNDGERKVYILTDIQNMTEQAQNALLKILEEPPAYVMFLLTCCGRSRVLETVQSRCLPARLGPVGQQEISRALLEKNPQAQPEAVNKAAALAGGLLGRALLILEQGGASAAASLAEPFAAALCGTDAYAFLRLSGTLEKDTDLLRAFLELLPLLLRDALAHQAGAAQCLSGCDTAARRLAAGMTRRQLAELIRLGLSAGAAQARYANAALLVTWLFSSLWACAHGAAPV